MPEYLSPAVYVDEVSSGSKPIEGVGTSTGAFVGGAVRGPVGKAVLITNFTQFLDTFGGFHQDHLLTYGVRAFFGQGGTRCYVARGFRSSDPTGDPEGINDTSKASLQDGSSNNVLEMQATSPGTWGNSISVEIAPADVHPAGDPGKEFSLSVRFKAPGSSQAEVVERYGRLSLEELTADGQPNPIHAEQVVNGVSKYVVANDLGPDPTITDPPAPTTSPVDLTGGKDGDPGGLTLKELVGDHTSLTGGLYAFDPIDDVNIVALPDLMGLADADARSGSLEALNYCEGRKDCFFVADVPEGTSPQDAKNYKQAQSPFSGNPFNSSYGALHYPWIYVADPLTGGRKLVPPSGAVAGTYSGTDVRRGVHKAPAGTEDGRLRVALGLERLVTKGEHDVLNPEGINVIRSFPEAGIVVWGARTLSADPEWKYVNVRRLFLFLEESIDEGTQWTVFEPNDPVLWKRITRNVSAFLRIQWLDGKLVGSSPEEAFFVKCDEETNPQESVDLGRVITLVGVAPSKPAEFVIFRIQQQKPGGEG